MGAAAAQLTVESSGESFQVDRGCDRVDETRDPHHDAVHAVAALCGLELEEGLEHGVVTFLGPEPLGGHHHATGGFSDRHLAGLHRDTIDEHRACPALTDPATGTDGLEVELLAERDEQRNTPSPVSTSSAPLTTRGVRCSVSIGRSTS